MFEYLFPIFCFGVVVTGIVVKGLIMAADMADAQMALGKQAHAESDDDQIPPVRFRSSSFRVQF